MVGTSGSGKRGSAPGGGGKNSGSLTNKYGLKEVAAIPQSVLKARAANFFAKPVGSSAGGGAAGGAPVGSAAGGSLRPAEQQLADKLLLTVDANSEHGVIKVMGAGRWPSSEQRHAGGAGFVAAQRRDREEEEDGVEDPVPDDVLGKEW